MTREKLAAIYLDWVNNYLTVERFAEHHGLYESEAQALIALARQCFEQSHPEA